MKAFATALKQTAVLAILLFPLSGCETTGADSGGSYYDSGFYDPWYYGGYYNDPYMIVGPPPARPEDAPRPEHPIATPPASLPQVRPMPSIPSTPRPGFHR